MIIDSVVQPDNQNKTWKLAGPCGETLLLPAYSSGSVKIGFLGTRSEAVKKAKTIALADTLDGLNLPITICDIRLGGSGGSGSWGPLEFKTIIPEMKNNGKPYAFFHLPLLAPVKELLASYRKAGKMTEVLHHDDITYYSSGIESKTLSDDDIPVCGWKHWEIFRASYRRDLSGKALMAGRAFVESMNAAGGICIFLCAEEYLPAFNNADRNDQDEFYCHRYTAGTAIIKSLLDDMPDLTIEKYHLRLGAEAKIEIIKRQ